MAIRQKVQPTRTYVPKAVRSKVGSKPPKPGSKPAGAGALKRSKNV